MYDRKLVNVNNVKKYLKYKDEVGDIMINDAMRMANSKYNFSGLELNEKFI